MPEGHAQICERHIAACVVMTTFRGYSCIVWMQEWPPWCCQVHTCNVRGFSLSSNQCHQGLSPRNIAPHRNPSGLTLILRLFFCSGIRHVFTLCCAFRRILSACNRCIFLTKKGRRVSPLRPGPGANCHYGSLTPAWHVTSAYSASSRSYWQEYQQ